MRRLITGVIMFMFISSNCAQYGGIIEYKIKTWNELKNSTLYVVYEEDGISSYDTVLKKAVTSNWTFSEVEYINYDKFEEIQKDESNFFLLSAGLTRTEAGRYDQSYSYLYLIRGYKKGAKKDDISQFPKLASLQTGNNAREVYLPFLIKNLNRNINEVLLGNLNSRGDGVKTIKNNNGLIKQKPLYVLELDLNDKITSAADIKEDYSGAVFIVTEEELSKKITANEDINVFMTSRSSTKSYVFVYNVNSGEELYTAFNVISNKYPAGIIPYHTKKWNK